MKYCYKLILLFVLLLFVPELFAFKVRQHGSRDFDINIKPLRSQYMTGQPVYFSISGNKSFYLYIFNICPKSKVAYVVLPNSLQQFNRYIAGRTYTVPDRFIEFVVENEDQLTFIIVACTKELNILQKSFKKSGAFFKGSSEFIERQIKGFYKNNNKEPDKEIIIKEINIPIMLNDKQSLTFNRPPDQKSVFISSSRLFYRLNDIMRITYGADHPGFVFLYFMDPMGQYRLLKKQRVSGKNFYQVNGVASSPVGDYQIIAIYNQNGNINGDNALRGIASRGIQLIEPEFPLAIYNITILK